MTSIFSADDIESELDELISTFFGILSGILFLRTVYVMNPIERKNEHIVITPGVDGSIL